ncbi:IclR family transcriptional regulator [Streptomyces sp. NPDC001604]|uniref:IclR family transcriptional regulator n=1 Tax=Streptomyces sp. NPDC001604 TaxID=3364593 RepID=UPI0036A4013F
MQSVLNALRVLEEVADRQPAGLSGLARGLGMPKSTVQRCLLTLEEAGWARVDSAGQWEVTSRAFSVGAKVANSAHLRDLAVPVLNELQAATGETVHLMIPDGYEMVLVERIDSAHQLRTVHPLGGRTALHCGANGKSYLATFSDDDLDQYLGRPLAAATPRTLTDPERLREELERIRDNGYATADEELAEGAVAIAAVIRHPGRTPVATLSISAPKARVGAELFEPYGHLVREAAQKIAAQLPLAR